MMDNFYGGRAQTYSSKTRCRLDFLHFEKTELFAITEKVCEAPEDFAAALATRSLFFGTISLDLSVVVGFFVFIVFLKIPVGILHESHYITMRSIG